MYVVIMYGMYDDVATIVLKQRARNIGHNEIPVCFVKDEDNVLGLGKFYERTQGFRSTESASL